MMFSELPDIDITNVESSSNQSDSESRQSELANQTEMAEQRLVLLDRTDHLRVHTEDHELIEEPPGELMETQKPRDREIYEDASWVANWASMCKGSSIET